MEHSTNSCKQSQHENIVIPWKYNTLCLETEEVKMKMEDKKNFSFLFNFLCPFGVQLHKVYYTADLGL